MLFEIRQIQKHLAERFRLKFDENGVHGTVPDGDYTIPLGVKEKECIVTIHENRVQDIRETE